MRNLASVSLCLLLAAGCAFPLFDGYATADRQWTETDPDAFWFRTDTAYSLFSASFENGKDRFSGLLVYNPLAGNGCRIIFLTEFGLKVFDLEYTAENEFVVHAIMPALDREMMIRVLQHDMGLLTVQHVSLEKARLLHDRRTGDTVLQLKEGRNRYNCFLDGGTGKVYRIVQSSRLFRKVQVDYISTDGYRLDAVTIRHFHIKLKIKLIRIDEIKTPADGQAV